MFDHKSLIVPGKPGHAVYLSVTRDKHDVILRVQPFSTEDDEDSSRLVEHALDPDKACRLAFSLACLQDDYALMLAADERIQIRLLRAGADRYLLFETTTGEDPKYLFEGKSDIALERRHIEWLSTALTVASGR